MINKIDKRIISVIFVGLLTLLLSPMITAANIDKRVFSFQYKLAKSGNVDAQYKLAIMYETGRGVNVDTKKASSWYSKAAAKGNHAARHRLTYLAIKSSGFKSKHRAWLNKIQSDALNGDSEALFLLAELYQYGTGVKADLNKARHYYKLSTAKGNANAEIRLYVLVQKLNKISRDKEKKKAEIVAQRKEVLRKIKQEKAKKIANQKAKQAAIKANRLRKNNERKKNISKNKLFDANKRKLENQRLAELKRKEMSKRKAEKIKASNDIEVDVFESDLCSGAAARFRTQCN